MYLYVDYTADGRTLADTEMLFFANCDQIFKVVSRFSKYDRVWIAFTFSIELKKLAFS